MFCRRFPRKSTSTVPRIYGLSTIFGAGRIVYSDERRLIGHRYRLDPDERSAFTAPGAAPAEDSDLSRPENRFERQEKKLLEVYAPVTTNKGRTLLFETYLRFSSISATGHRIGFAFAPALVLGLVLL